MTQKDKLIHAINRMDTHAGVGLMGKSEKEIKQQEEDFELLMSFIEDNTN